MNLTKYFPENLSKYIFIFAFRRILGGLLRILALCLHTTQTIYLFGVSSPYSTIFNMIEMKCMSRVLKVTLKTHWIESGMMMTVECEIGGFDWADL